MAKAAGPVNVSSDWTDRQMRILRADAAAIARAADVLRAGGLVAFPTETVYGLGARAGDPRAVAALYAAKGRPSFNPLIAHVSDLAAAERLGAFTEDALTLAKKFWPGPLTIVVDDLLPIMDDYNRAHVITEVTVIGIVIGIGVAYDFPPEDRKWYTVRILEGQAL